MHFFSSSRGRYHEDKGSCLEVNEVNFNAEACILNPNGADMKTTSVIEHERPWRNRFIPLMKLRTSYYSFVCLNS